MSPSVQGRRRFLLSNLTAAASLAALPELLAAPAEEALYNGIRLPSPWPPRINDVPAEPAVPPYLTSPPDVIPIDAMSYYNTKNCRGPFVIVPGPCCFCGRRGPCYHLGMRAFSPLGIDAGPGAGGEAQVDVELLFLRRR